MSVRHAVLGLLHQRARHGYELQAALAALSPENWDVKPAQIYATLERLADAGLVREQRGTQVAGPQRRPYELTSEGLTELRSWFSVPVKSSLHRDEFFLKLMLSILPPASSPQGSSRVHSPYQVLHIQRSSLYRDLHELIGQRQDAQLRGALAEELQLEQIVMHVEADLRWLELIEGRLDEMAKKLPTEPAPRPRGRPRKTPSESEGD
ncbi:MAG: PadR family transcriptional regulator [Archangium sp.]|nr:PadR family transcriptional regulator [Archangium sp.]